MHEGSTPSLSSIQKPVAACWEQDFWGQLCLEDLVQAHFCYARSQEQRLMLQVKLNSTWARDGLGV